MRATPMLFALCLAAGGCFTSRHVVRRIEARRSPRAEACTTVPLYSDRGPTTGRVAIAIVTAECRTSKETECREHLQHAGCEANADAVVEVTRREADGHLRMVGTAVEFLSE
jgi:hypothetical protein